VEYLELIITIELKKDIDFDEAGFVIGKNINKSMLFDEELKELHPKNQYKNYVFDTFYPFERDKKYKSGKLYIFKIRSIDVEMMKKMRKCLRVLRSFDFKILAIDAKLVKQRKIKTLHTLSPVILTIDDQPWLQNQDIKIFNERMIANLEKKYKSYFNEDLKAEVNLVKSIEFKNRKPVGLKYKNIKLLGNKVSIEVKEDEISQKLAFIALATGIGEKNSALGAGFCKAEFIK
jgi:CRISPR-associated endoribonuclease Cas6